MARDHRRTGGTARHRPILRGGLSRAHAYPTSPNALEELADGAVVDTARRWIDPFRAAFPDLRMEIVELIAEGDKVVARFRCSGTHLGEWLGQLATGRR